MLLKDAIIIQFFLLTMDMTVLGLKAIEGHSIANQEGGLALAQPPDGLGGLVGNPPWPRYHQFGGTQKNQEQALEHNHTTAGCVW